MATLVRHIQVFYDPDIRGLREGGSRATDDRHLHTHGRNVFTMLRKWRDRREDVPRFTFVHEGLKAAFPGIYGDLDFEAGQTISARVFRPGDEMPNPISHEANGLLSMLLLLAQVAATHSGGLVAIDEPETSLHPYAIRRFVRLARAWAQRNDLTIVLTTHSPVLLDEFNGEPDRIFVLERGREALPVRLDELRARE
jgi:predicted ATPase